MQLSPHFTLEEFVASQEATRKGLDNTPSPEVVEALKDTAQRMENVRAILGHPIMVSSGYRSEEVNKCIGGTVNSAHITGHAVDFIAPGYGTCPDVWKKLCSSDLQFDQCIQEFNWVHLSFDPRMRRQHLTANFGTNGTTYT